MLERNLAERQIKRQNWDGMLETLLRIQMDEKLVQLAEDVQYDLRFFPACAGHERKRLFTVCLCRRKLDKLEVKHEDMILPKLFAVKRK